MWLSAASPRFSISDAHPKNEFSNALALQPTPRERVLSPKLWLIDVKAEDLAAALVKLVSSRRPCRALP